MPRACWAAEFFVIETERLRLRVPEPRDVAALHALWSDPLVMADLGPVKSHSEGVETLARHDGYRQRGLGFWSVELRETDVVIGFCGLKPGAHDTPAENEVEIGWTILSSHWGRGYALEASIAGLRHAWNVLRAPRVVAITSARNRRSRALMERLAMQHICDFEQPIYAPGDALRPSVMYGIERPERPHG